MSATPKAAAIAKEEEVAAYLRGWGFPVRRVVQDGMGDRGDLEGLPDFALQVKAPAVTGATDLPAWLRDVAAQRRRGAERFGAVIVARRGRGAPLVREAMVSMTLETFASLLALLDLERGLRPSSTPDL